MFGEETSMERSQRVRFRHERLELATCTPSRVRTLEMLMRACSVVHSTCESGMTRSAWR
jgi:hypothetical protein